MKSLFQAVLAASLLATSLVSFAQSTVPLTRAEVQAQLVQIEKAGYQPRANDIHYPEDIQTAERQVATQNQTDVANDNSSGLGPSIDGSYESGTRVGPVEARSTYFGH